MCVCARVLACVSDCNCTSVYGACGGKITRGESLAIRNTSNITEEEEQNSKGRQKTTTGGGGGAGKGD